VSEDTEKPDGIFQGHGAPWRGAQGPFHVLSRVIQCQGRWRRQMRVRGDTRLMASKAGEQPPPHQSRSSSAPPAWLREACNVERTQPRNQLLPTRQSLAVHPQSALGSQTFRLSLTGLCHCCTQRYWLGERGGGRYMGVPARTTSRGLSAPALDSTFVQNPVISMFFL
jgi:hypothetical protein